MCNRFPFGVCFRVSMLSPDLMLWGLSTPMVGVCGFSDWPMLRASNPRIDVACTQDSLVNQTPSVSGWLLCVERQGRNRTLLLKVTNNHIPIFMYNHFSKNILAHYSSLELSAFWCHMHNLCVSKSYFKEYTYLFSLEDASVSIRASQWLRLLSRTSPCKSVN